jgi:hypothetical protein
MKGLGVRTFILNFLVECQPCLRGIKGDGGVLGLFLNWRDLIKATGPQLGIVLQAAVTAHRVFG